MIWRFEAKELYESVKKMYSEAIGTGEFFLVTGLVLIGFPAFVLFLWIINSIFYFIIWNFVIAPAFMFPSCGMLQAFAGMWIISILRSIFSTKKYVDSEGNEIKKELN